MPLQNSLRDSRVRAVTRILERIEVESTGEDPTPAVMAAIIVEIFEACEAGGDFGAAHAVPAQTHAIDGGD